MFHHDITAEEFYKRMRESREGLAQLQAENELAQEAEDQRLHDEAADEKYSALLVVYKKVGDIIDGILEITAEWGEEEEESGYEGDEEVEEGQDVEDDQEVDGDEGGHHERADSDEAKPEVSVNDK